MLTNNVENIIIIVFATLYKRKTIIRLQKEHLTRSCKYIGQAFAHGPANIDPWKNAKPNILYY
jgi:hypothetical protein